MSEPQNTILNSSLRTFCTAAAATVGVGIALMIVVLLGGILGGGSHLDSQTKEHVLPNADGIRKPLGFSGPVILQIEIQGVVGAESLTKEKIRQILIESRERALESDRVKAILLNINTPGGKAMDASTIYQLIKEYKSAHDIPVLAYVDGLCASGGMMIAAAADKIFASDQSLVGSVGVIVPPIFNFHKLMERWDVSQITIKAGENKDTLNPFRPWDKDEGKELQTITDSYYESFVDMVIAARPRLDRDKLIHEYGANVFPAKKAKELGYIDEASTSYSEALKALTEMADIQDEDYRVVQLDNKNWVSDIFNSKSPLFSGRVEHHLNLGPHYHPDLEGHMLYLWVPGKT